MAVANTAWAKPPKLYGTLEQVLSRTTSAGTESVNTLDSDDTTIGIKGSVPLSDNLNGDLKLIYNVSAGLNAEEGGSHVWKNMFIIAKSKYIGSTKMGRGKTFMGIAGDKSMDDFFVTTSMDSSMPGFVSNYIGYTTPRLLGLQAGISRSDRFFNKEADPVKDAVENRQVMINFITGPIKLYAVSSLDESPVISWRSQTRFIGGQAKFGMFTVFGGHEKVDYDVGTKEDRIINTAGVNIKMGDYGLSVGGSDIEGFDKAPKMKPAGRNYTAEASYKFTKATQASLGYQYINADSVKDTATTSISLMYKF